MEYNNSYLDYDFESAIESSPGDYGGDAGPEPYFPQIFSHEQLRQGLYLVFVLGVAITVVGISAAANRFLAPSVLVLANTFDISAEFTESVLLVAAYSFPKLLICIVGNMFAFNNIGSGLIIGAGIWNLCAGVGCCLKYSTSPLQLEFWDTFKDFFTYSIVVALLLLCSNYGSVDVKQPIYLIVVYLIYCLRFRRKSSNNAASAPIALETFSRDEPTQLELEPTPGPIVIKSPVVMPQEKWDKIFFILMAPIIYPMHATLPDMSKPSSRDWFFITLVGSMAWIGGFSYPLVWCSTVVAQGIGTPPELFGLTVLTLVSTPDLSRTIESSKKGLGGKALLLCLRQNIYDLSFVLPVSWLMFTYLTDRSKHLPTFLCLLLPQAFLLPLVLLLTFLSTRTSPSKFGSSPLCLLIVVYTVIIFGLTAVVYGFLSCPKKFD